MADEGDSKSTATNDQKREDPKGYKRETVALLGLFGAASVALFHWHCAQSASRHIQKEFGKLLPWKRANGSFGSACQLEEEELKATGTGMRGFLMRRKEKLVMRYVQAAMKRCQIYIEGRELRFIEGRLTWCEPVRSCISDNLNNLYSSNGTSFGDQSDDFRQIFRQTPGCSAETPLSQHYMVLGLDRFSSKPYTEVEIKIAFEDKVKEICFEQNQNDKGDLEAKINVVLESYDAVMSDIKG